MRLTLSRKSIWERLPPTLRYGVGGLLRAIPQETLLGPRFCKTTHWLALSERWPADRIRAYQLEQLRRICTLAYERAPFYRRWFERCGFRPDDLRRVEDLSALPRIDKSVVRENLNAMCTRSRSSWDVERMSTGGTGGQPLHFYIDADRSGTEYAYLVASWARAGFTLGTPLAVLRGRVVRPRRDGLRHEYDPILRHHHYSSFHMTDENMRRYLKQIATLGPCFLHVYPSAVATLARFMQRCDIRAPDNIRGIIAESEIVYPEQRRTVEEVFGCRYFSCYGHSEKLVLAAECERSTNYHVWPSYGYFELLDEDGRPVTSPGDRGEIVGTGFINTVVPFIRYRTGDYATYVGDRCEACGREHPIITEIRGHRTQEVLIAADGSEISWTAVNMHDDTFRNVQQFQFYQVAPGQATLRLLPAENFGGHDRRRITRNLQRKLDGRFTFTIELVAAIPLSPRGKAIYVDQRVAPVATTSTEAAHATNPCASTPST